MDIKNVLINLRDDLMKWTTNNIKALQATIPSTDDFATPEYVDEKLEDIDLTGYVKTVNSVPPNEDGNVTIELPDIKGNCRIAYGTCSTAAATAEKTVVVEDTNWKLEVGSMVVIRFSVSNSASNVTINVNGTGAYPILASGSEYTGSSTNYTGYANRTYTYMFNGTHWVWISNGTYPSSTTNASIGHGYGVCSTAEATLAKACTISSYTLATGGSVSIKFTNAVPANSTLNIRTRGAKKIFYKGTAITDGVIKAGDTATFVYDGTQYQLISIDSPSSTKKGTEVFFISGDTEASTQGHWVGQHPDITELYEGLVIAYQIPIAGGTSNTYIKINDFEEKIIYFNRASAMKEQYLPGSTIFLVYTNYNDRLTFRVADYDSNTNTRNTIGDYQSTDTKLYLAGSKTIDTSDDDSYATSFVNPNVYIGTDNALYSENKKVATEAYTSSLLDIDYDSLLAFDTTEIIKRLNYVDSDNSIILEDGLLDGTYTLKYEFEDGTYTDIKNFIIQNEPIEIEIDVMKESEKYLNQRWSKSSNKLTTQLGRVAFIFPINTVNIDTVCTVTIKNSPVNLKTYKDYFTMYFLNGSKTETFDIQDMNPEYSGYPGYDDSFVWSNNSCTFSITVVPSCKYIVLNLPLNATGTEAVESDLSDLIITLKKEGAN